MGNIRAAWQPVGFARNSRGVGARFYPSRCGGHKNPVNTAGIYRILGREEKPSPHRLLWRETKVITALDVGILNVGTGGKT